MSPACIVSSHLPKLSKGSGATLVSRQLVRRQPVRYLLKASGLDMHSTANTATATDAAAMTTEIPRGSYADKVLGCILAALCGDALGASVEGWTPQRIQGVHKDGLTTYQNTDRGYGCYTDDGQMLLALAASLINRRRCCAQDAAAQYACAFDPQRGYGGSAVKILLRLASGADPATTGTQFLPEGSFGNGGAMRIAPVALAYRNADISSLTKAVEAALLCTHVHPLGVEGALAQAIAVAQLSKMQPTPNMTHAGAQPQHMNATASSAAAQQSQEQQPQPQNVQFLQQLQRQLSGRSVEMVDKLQVLQQALAQVPCQLKYCSQPWNDYLTSAVWAHELTTAAAVAPGFQIKATDAVAAAIWAAVCHWDCPADAVVAAVHYGGDTDTIACMTGALMGALHGSAWLPQGWLDHLENSSKPPDAFFSDKASSVYISQVITASTCSGSNDNEEDLVLTTKDMGRDAAVVLAHMLARLDCRQ
eukprot:GHRR01000185.1.p1 GENE.GHRR01000185.1~~GHRR01000185.1.p1  ORF type:complete len:477 (+),score=171.76 GHRR01000185.1:587-2017(+)